MYQQPPQPQYPQYPYPYPPQPQPPARRGYPVPIIALVASALLVVVLVCCAFLGIASLLSPSSPAHTTSATLATSTTASAPQPAATLQQQYLQLATDVAPDDTITLQLDAQTGAVTMTDNIGEQLSVSAAVSICHARAYYFMRALFTQADPTPARVTLRILGPASDAAGNTDPNSLYATVTLTAATASHITWPGLSFAAAWNAYDTAQLAPGLAG